VPDGELSAFAAIRNVATRHGSRTYLFILIVAAVFGRLAYDSFVEGEWLWGAGYAGIGGLTIVLFVVDSAGCGRCAGMGVFDGWREPGGSCEPGGCCCRY
jgi:hypothetical protein